MTIKIMTDSAADIPPDLIDKYDLAIVPTVIRFGDDVYYEDKTISLEQFYKLFYSHLEHPQTANPTLADDFELYKKLGKEADEVINIVISSGISGSYNTSHSALKMYEKRVENSSTIHIFDSHFASFGIGVMALKAAEMVDQGKKIDEILKVLYEYRSNIDLAFTVDNLKYLHRGGRLSKSKFWVAKIADLHPIITLNEGLMEVEKTERGFDKAIIESFRLVWKKLEKPRKFNAYICHGENKDSAKFLRDYISDKIKPEWQYRLMPVGATILTHTGPEITGILIDPYNKTFYS